MKLKIKGILAVCAITITIGCIFCTISQKQSIVGYEPYIVGHGDTLWKIAETVDSPVDVREIIYEIEAKNNCNANIHAGQLIYIPVYGN